MPRVLLTGGRQRASRGLSDDHSYEAGLVLGLDTDSGEITPLMEYASPPEICRPKNPNHVFKAGSWDGDHLLLCTETEVLFVDPDTFRKVRGLSHPWMNDVHHVTRIDGHLHVVATGMDCLLVLDDEGACLRAEPALDEDLWARFDPDEDYRHRSNKPHASHPNYVFATADGRWLTRLSQFDAICLDDRTKRMDLGPERVHDGVHDGERVWFTVVNGHLVEVDPTTREVVTRYDLNAIEETEGPLGWCRGVLVEDGLAWVGFSRIRQTKLRQNLGWVRRGFRGQPPLATRIVGYDLARRQKVAEWPIDGAGMDAVFSLLPWDR